MAKTKLIRFRYKDENINSKKKATRPFFTAWLPLNQQLTNLFLRSLLYAPVSLRSALVQSLKHRPQYHNLLL